MVEFIETHKNLMESAYTAVGRLASFSSSLLVPFSKRRRNERINPPTGGGEDHPNNDVE